MHPDELPSGKVAPHDEQAERGVLAAILLDPERLAEAAEVLREEDFHSKRNGMIFAACVGLDERNVGIDLTTLAAHLKADEKLAEVGGIAYLAEVATAASTAAFLVHPRGDRGPDGHAAAADQRGHGRGPVGLLHQARPGERA